MRKFSRGQRRAARLLCALLCISPAWAGSPPYSLPAALASMVGQVAVPNVEVIFDDGQSNAMGYDPAGGSATHFVAAGIYTLNSQTAPSALIPVQYGVGPFANGSGCSTSTPNSCYVNSAIWTANYLRASGRIAATMPIVILPNFYPNMGIVNWIGAGTSSQYYVNFVAQMTFLRTLYPSAVVNIWIRKQGEADSGSTGPYNNQASFCAAQQTLLGQYRASGFWSPTTIGTIQQLAPWYDNSAANARNDCIMTYAGGAVDPSITVTSGDGLTESAVNTGPHFDGPSYMTIGYRDYGAMTAAPPNGSLSTGALVATDGHAFTGSKKFTVAASSTLNLGQGGVQPGAVVTLNASSTLSLPNPAVLPWGSTVTISGVGQGAITSQATMVWARTGAGITSVTVESGYTYEADAYGTAWWVRTTIPNEGNQIARNY
jgi:hypothetical protein